MCKVIGEKDIERMIFVSNSRGVLIFFAFYSFLMQKSLIFAL